VSENSPIPYPDAADWAADVRVGAGFKPEHFQEIWHDQPRVDFFEVHAENYMGAGGAPHRMLTALGARYQLSVHGVGLSIGAAGGLDLDHLARLKAVVDRYQPALVSEHLAWSTHSTKFYNDLLPVPYRQDVLATVISHVDQLQDSLGRRVLIENPSTYFAFGTSEMSEIEFIVEMQRASGCALILDINNVFISANNQNMSAHAYLDRFPMHAVKEIHLAGHATDEDDAGQILLIDAHDRPVADPVWQLYARTIAQTGPIPTLIEWDNDVPAWPVLFEEITRAGTVLAAHRTGAHPAEMPGHVG
jgi:hypothetical protein